jgi:hypothetical protein
VLLGTSRDKDSNAWNTWVHERAFLLGPSLRMRKVDLLSHLLRPRCSSILWQFVERLVPKEDREGQSGHLNASGVLQLCLGK